MANSWSLDVWFSSILWSKVHTYRYSEKATIFCEIFPLPLNVCTVVKSKGKISQNFVAFSEFMNFTYNWMFVNLHQYLQLKPVALSFGILITLWLCWRILYQSAFSYFSDWNFWQKVRKSRWLKKVATRIPIGNTDDLPYCHF